MKERIERLKKLTYIPQKEIAWLIEQAELAVKQREIIEENKRQQASVPAGSKGHSAFKRG